jgi:hypothetical protein
MRRTFVKKALITLALFCTGAAAFAQTQPQAFLSKSDIDIFAENSGKIREILDAHKEEFFSLQDEMAARGYPIEEAFTMILEFPVSAKLRAELSGFGLGNTGYEKIIVIYLGTTFAVWEQIVAEELAGQEEAPQVAGIRERMARMAAMMHADDLSLISSRVEDLRFVVMGNF